MPSMPAPLSSSTAPGGASDKPFAVRDRAPGGRRRRGSRPGRATRRAAAPRPLRFLRPAKRGASVVLPLVSVPVLSRISTRARASASSAPPPFTRMPCRAARETPAISATGTARISGQGVAMTSTARSRRSSPVIEPGAAGKHKRQRQKAERVAVGEAAHRRLHALRRFDEAQDVGVGAFRRRLRRLKVEGRALVGRAAHRGFARRALAPAAPRRSAPTGRGSAMPLRRPRRRAARRPGG